MTVRRRLRALYRPLAIGLLALCVAVASGFGGISYTVCLGSGRLHVTSCCPAARRALAADPRADDAVSNPIRVCCEGHRVDSLPRSEQASGHHDSVMPAALFATLSIAEMFACAPLPDAHECKSQHPARAGPESPLFELNRAYLI